MSHTCGKKQVKGIADWLRRGLKEADKFPMGRAQWLERVIREAIKDADHVAACMEPGPDDPERDHD